MRSYTVQQGDTFDAISRRVYGVETGVGLIKSANPGASDPPVAGSSLVIPDAVQSLPPVAPSVDPEEVALRLNGERFRAWETVSITRNIDTFDTVEFTAPFEPQDLTFRDTFRPMKFRDAAIDVGGSRLFSGTVLTPAPNLTETSRRVTVAAYSRAAVLNDSQPPASLFPLEFNGQTLFEIAAALCAPFGLAAVFLDDPGPAFDKVAIAPTKTVFSSLIDLAKQRGLIITNDENGNLLFQKSVQPGNPVAIFSEGDGPIGAVTPRLNPQKYYSHVTGIQPAATGAAGSQYTVENPHLTGIIRPHTFTANDTKSGDLKTAVEATAGRMFAGAVSYVVPVATWRDSSGELWRPNTNLILQAPGAMIYNPYEFVIRQVTFTRAANSESAALVLMLPGAFSGQIPEAMPWDE